MRGLVVSCLLVLSSFFSLSCNQPFQPAVEYSPKLNVYAILIADAQAVYVRVMSVVKSQSDLSLPVHGAEVRLFGSGMNDTTFAGIRLADTTEVVDGDSVSFYYAPVHVGPGGYYSVSVNKDGYPPVFASAVVPMSYGAIPDQNSYGTLKNPERPLSPIKFRVNLSDIARGAFVQMSVEYRGLDAAGKFHTGSFNVSYLDPQDPFTETNASVMTVNVDTAQYRSVFEYAREYADSLAFRHMYVNFIVTQVDDNFYRFFLTSLRTFDPLVMRTDKIIFTNILGNAGMGIVSGVSIDTTRIFLF
jgi:hypothetical protein